MNLFSKRNIKTLLKKYQTKPLKRLGQNFLIDKGAAKRVVEAAELKPNDTVLEIGPGIGTLTQGLAKGTKKVIAIEKDPKMIEILKETMKEFKNVEIIQSDILKLDPKPYTLNPYKIVANLPFYLTAPVIRKFLESTKVQPSQMVLIIQKEVGQRICPAPTRRRGEAGANPPKMNLLAVSVQFYAQTEIISYISKKSFWPSPKVDSAILRIIPQINTDKKQINTDLFFKIVRFGFSQPRKQLINNLTKNLKIDKIKIEQWLIKNKIQPSQRAETLSIENWLKLAKNYKINQ